MRAKIPYWAVVVSGGDGSARTVYFSTRQKAEDYAALEDEPFCEAVCAPREVEIDPKHYKERG